MKKSTTNNVKTKLDTKKLEQDINTKITKKIKLLRVLNNISQSELADLLNISFQQLQKYEKGVSKITASKLCIIAKIFNINHDFFLQDSMNIIDIEPISKDTEANLKDFMNVIKHMPTKQ
jgi:transcriptional regulator with XRE-family HTH domain